MSPAVPWGECIHSAVMCNSHSKDPVAREQLQCAGIHVPSCWEKGRVSEVYYRASHDLDWGIAQPKIIKKTTLILPMTYLAELSNKERSINLTIFYSTWCIKMHNTKFDVNEPHENHKFALICPLNEWMHIDMNKFGSHTRKKKKKKKNFSGNND